MPIWTDLISLACPHLSQKEGSSINAEIIIHSRGGGWTLSLFLDHAKSLVFVCAKGGGLFGGVVAVVVVKVDYDTKWLDDMLSVYYLDNPSRVWYGGIEVVGFGSVFSFAS